MNYDLDDLVINAKSCSSEKLFFDPDNPLNLEEEQIKRQESALKLNVKKVDTLKQTGTINDYDVSLDFCPCVDFSRRKKPCKHMYRLAHELGIFHLNGNVVIDSSIKNEAEKKAIGKKLLKIVSGLNSDEKSILYSVMYKYLYHGKIPLTLEKTDSLNKLINQGLLSSTDINIESLADFFKKSELSSIVKENKCVVKLTKKQPFLKP